MQSWYNIFPKNTGLSIYVWIIFCALPFYFIFRSSSSVEITIGILMIFFFFIAYRLSFLTKGWPVYVWIACQIVISILMTILYGYVYFAIFLAFFIGNIQNKVGFYTLYAIHLITTIAAVNISFFTQKDLFFSQFPYVVISVIGVILLPFNAYNRNRQEKLEGQLEDANKTIAQLMIIEERQRIARDLHDVLGQKLSLIGLKSDLASKLIQVNPSSALNEIHDIHHTARTALKEVREMVSGMRESKLEDELMRIRQILAAAQIEFTFEGQSELNFTPLLIENMVSMCLKEAVTNVVKHSQATHCQITIKEDNEALFVKVKDNGVSFDANNSTIGNGLRGMEERLEFINGSLRIITGHGTAIEMRVPHVIKQKNGWN